MTEQPEEVAEPVHGVFEVGLGGVFMAADFGQVFIDDLVGQLQGDGVEKQGQVGNAAAVTFEGCLRQTTEDDFLLELLVHLGKARNFTTGPGNYGVFFS